MKSVIVKDEASAMSLAKEMKNGTWVVLYYAEWCGHCSQMKPEWNKFKSSCNKNVNIGEVEHSSMDLLHKRPEIKGYPTIRMYNNNTEVGEFEQERTEDKMLDFVNSHLSSKDNKHDEPASASNIMNNISKSLSYKKFSKKSSKKASKKASKKSSKKASKKASIKKTKKTKKSTKSRVAMIKKVKGNPRKKLSNAVLMN